jgi:dTDP-4-amino-4,6-dideoxygalactose transaminase
MREPFIPYCRPDVGEAEARACAESIRAGWLTTGPQCETFERNFENASGVAHAVALNSCTAGLHLALVAFGVGPGDEVVMPSLTFVAGAQCALELGARPVFCDVEPDTFAASIRTIAPVISPRTKAIIAMPYAGRPLAMAELCDFAHKLGIAVIEDAAHASGMLDRGTWAGTFSDAAVYSFYATKNIATGEGGMFLTNDAELSDRVRRLSLHGMTRDAWKRYTNNGSWRYDVSEPGYKYNLSDMPASLGIVQLKRLDEMQENRRRIAAEYRSKLSDLPGIALQRDVDDASDRHSWCMFAVTVDRDRARVDRDTFIEELRGLGIGTSVHYIPTHSFTGYASLQRDALPVTDLLGSQLLSLPLYPTLLPREVERVVTAVREVALGRLVANCAG